MAEKKIHKKTVDTLKRFEKWELKNAAFLYEKSQKGQLKLPEAIEDTAFLFVKKDRLSTPGVLSIIYLTYLDYQKECKDENQKSIEGVIDKYGRYADVLIKVPPVKHRKLSTDENYRREALKVNAARNRRGDQRYSDLYNSKMLVEDSGDDILFCGPWKKWLIWDGRRWEKDEVNGIYQLAIDAIKGIYEKALNKKNDEDALTLMEHAGRSETARKIEAMVRVTAWKKKVRVHPDDLDRENMIFNCANGSIDLISGRLLEHDRSRRITKISPIEYDEHAACPIWEEFLKSIFKKNKVLIQFVQKIIGMCLTGDVSAQAMFILYGTGANGKSTFINTIMKTMGDYGTNTPTETLIQKKGDAANNDIARLKGTRFVSAMEADYGGKMAEAVVKRLTGNDTISARFLYGEYFDFTPTFKIFMATNHKPKITGMDNAIWRRIKLIPFEVIFSEKKQDPKLAEKLEEELTGILAWMVEGCILWQKEGLGNPPAIDAATKEYRYEMSAVETFLQERCYRDEKEMIKALFLYESYKEWAEENNEHIMSARAFGMRLAETGMDKIRITAGYHWIGVALKK